MADDCINTENHLKGIVDLHIHSAPDVRERKMDDLQLMEAAVKRGVRAVVIKSHHVPTVDRATLVNRVRKKSMGTNRIFRCLAELPSTVLREESIHGRWRQL